MEVVHATCHSRCTNQILWLMSMRLRMAFIPFKTKRRLGKLTWQPLNFTPCNRNLSMVMSCRITLATTKACLRHTIMEADSPVLHSPMSTISEAVLAFPAWLTHTRAHLVTGCNSILLKRLTRGQVLWPLISKHGPYIVLIAFDAFTCIRYLEHLPYSMIF